MGYSGAGWMIANVVEVDAEYYTADGRWADSPADGYRWEAEAEARATAEVVGGQVFPARWVGR